MGSNSSLCFTPCALQERRKSLKHFGTKNQELISKIRKLENLQTIYLNLMQSQKSLALKKISMNLDKQAQMYLIKYLFLKKSFQVIKNYFQHIKHLFQSQQSQTEPLRYQINPQNSGISRQQINRIDRLLVQLQKNKHMSQQIKNQNQKFYDQQLTDESYNKNSKIKELMIDLKHKAGIKKNLDSSFLYLQSIFIDNLQIQRKYIRNSKYIVNFCKKKYKLDLSQQCFSLYHTDFPINMEKFLKHDWTQVECLYLDGCEINNEDWENLVNHAYLFTQLKSLQIQDNLITQISGQDLLKFPKLKDITFSFQKWNNPLSYQTKNSLKRFKKENGGIHVYFQ